MVPSGSSVQPSSALKSAFPVQGTAAMSESLDQRGHAAWSAYFRPGIIRWAEPADGESPM